MEQATEILKELFTRDLRTSPLETAIFLFVVFGFFGALVAANIIKRKKERAQYLARLEQKWESLCEKLKLDKEEISFLSELAAYLRFPEKRYLLLLDYNVFHNSLEAYSQDHSVDQAMLKRVAVKLQLTPSERVSTQIPVQRRKSVRKAVNIKAMLAPIEQSTAHIPAQMMDLSAGGCKIENPDRRFNAGDDLKITFSYNGKEYKNIPCEVVRTGAGSRSLHLSFGHVRRK